MSNKNLKRKALKNDNLENVSGCTSQDQKLNQKFKREERIEYARKVINGEIDGDKKQAEEFLKKQGVIN